MLDKGDSFHALGDFDQSAQLNPDSPEPHMYRAIAKLRLKHFDGAIQDFNEYSC